MTFPEPSSEVIELARKGDVIAAIKAYRLEATTLLPDGSGVTVSLNAALTLLRPLKGTKKKKLARLPVEGNAIMAWPVEPSPRNDIEVLA